MTNTLTATERLTRFCQLVANERPAIMKRAETLQGAMELMSETGQSSVVDAISQAAKREAIRKGATL